MIQDDGLRTWITNELSELYRTVKASLPTPGNQEGKAPSAAALQSVIRTLELLIKHQTLLPCGIL